jgi:alanine dehydrogenase
MASKYNIERMTRIADILIGGVLLPGEKAPVIITRDMVKKMRKGSVLIDLAIDQGGCSETSRLTTLEQPTYIDEDVIHYCVPNITSAVSRTSSKVLSNLVVSYLINIGEKGIDKVLEEDESIRRGTYVFHGDIVRKTISERFGLEYKNI